MTDSSELDILPEKASLGDDACLEDVFEWRQQQMQDFAGCIDETNRQIEIFEHCVNGIYRNDYCTPQRAVCDLAEIAGLLKTLMKGCEFCHNLQRIQLLPSARLVRSDRFAQELMFGLPDYMDRLYNEHLQPDMWHHIGIIELSAAIVSRRYNALFATPHDTYEHIEELCDLYLRHYEQENVESIERYVAMVSRCSNPFEKLCLDFKGSPIVCQYQQRNHLAKLVRKWRRTHEFLESDLPSLLDYICKLERIKDCPGQSPVSITTYNLYDKSTYVEKTNTLNQYGKQ